MSKKLDFQYDSASGEYHALVGEKFRVRAVHDDSPLNPFEDGDQNWPLAVIAERNGKPQEYLGQPGDDPYNAPSDRFGDAEVIHLQYHIPDPLMPQPKIAAPADRMRAAFEAYMTEEPVGYCRDADTLSDLFDEIVGDMSEKDKFDKAVEMYYLLGIHAYRFTATGCSQGDQSEVLVVATPEAVARFGCEKHIYDLETEVKADPKIRDVIARIGGLPPAQFEEALKRYVYGQVSEKLLKPTAQLYEDWAFGNVYGYIVEKDIGVRPEFDEYGKCSNAALLPYNNGLLPDQDDEYEPEWVEVPDGSCWGFFGTDFDASGLAEAALECIPDEELADAVS